MKPDFSRQTFEKFSNIRLHENPSSGSRVDPCGRTDMTKLTVAFRNSVKGLKNCTFCQHSVFIRYVQIAAKTAIISLLVSPFCNRNVVCLLGGTS